VTREQRHNRIQVLTRELSALLAEEAPRPKIRWLTAADLPAWVAEGLREALAAKSAKSLGFP
jgi:hypothetical protein